MIHDRNNEKIDVAMQTTLSDVQCDIAIAIWRRMGVFDNNEAVAITDSRFVEENVWAQTFYNYSSINDKDANKVRRLTNQIIERARDIYKNFGVVARYNHRKGGESTNYICKMSSNAALTQHSRRIGSAATNIVTAHEIDESFPEKSLNTMKQLASKVESKIPDLVKRLEVFTKMEQALTQKKREVFGLLDNMNGGIAGQIEAAQPDQETQDKLDEMKKVPEPIDVTFEDDENGE